MKFPDLVAQISEIDGVARLTAGRTLQQVLSLRNWLIGAHIVEFEQAGEDRAAYGQALMATLAEALREAGCQGLSVRNLKNFRQVSLGYPGLDALGLGHRLAFPAPRIRQTSAESGPHLKLAAGLAPAAGTPAAPVDVSVAPFPSLARRAAEQPLPWRDAAWLTRLFTTLTFSHLLELSRIDDVTRRAFYELHCLKERWSVRELQRQRDSMLYERIGLSENRDAVLALAYPEENPPVGILLCAERDAEVVRFATADDGDLFVTRYQFELPTEEQLKRWLHEERARIEQAGSDS